MLVLKEEITFLILQMKSYIYKQENAQLISTL